MTEAARYNTMDLHPSPNTALPVWNNKPMHSLVPASTPEPVQPHDPTAVKGGIERAKGLWMLPVGPRTAPPPCWRTGRKG